MHATKTTLILAMLSLSVGLVASAQDASPAAAQIVIRYVELKPTFLTNFGVSDSGHLKYIKADVTVLVHNKDAEYAARYHLPALRNSLVMLLARQDESTVSSASGRETIKAEAMAEFREILAKEEGEGFIEDLMFTNFIVQR
jgi:flagellar FliL protein